MKKSCLVIVCVLLFVLFFAPGGRAGVKSIDRTYEGIIVKAYFQEVRDSYSCPLMKTIIVMEDRQLMFSGVYDDEIPLGVKVLIEVHHSEQIIDIKKIDK